MKVALIKEVQKHNGQKDYRLVQSEDLEKAPEEAEVRLTSFSVSLEKQHDSKRLKKNQS